ncbi:glycosyltransferase [Mesobacillus maritimus]|uniref:Glycosyltransferase n=1 Tax=Mesobacillus maritimus TaxID=1643336 RepID=A0ABS7K511_9BACI|nr:glycosyltransferase [Mesobacillus maritimus]MBY0097289.1 glycosyltransferase [Mesobacillus maritimus]
MLKRSHEKKNKDFVFQDSSGKRWPVVRLISILSFICLSVVVSVIVVSLFRTPSLSPLELEETKDILPLNKPIPASAEEMPELIFDKHKAPSQISKDEIYGFYISNDHLSKESLENNIDSLGVVIPNWYYLESDKEITKDSEQSIDAFAKKNNVKIMPRLYLKDPNNGELLHKMLNSSQSREAMIHSLYQQVINDGYTGINIDFRGINGEDKELLTTFMSELSQQFHANNLKVTLTVTPVGGPYDYAALSEIVDRMIVMLFDEHHENTGPGPLASVHWTQETLKQLPIPAEKLIVSLGNFGYDWTTTSTQAGQFVTFHETMETAHSSELKANWDEASRSPYIRYKKGEEQHIIWFLDAVTSYNQLKLALEHGIKGMAVHQLGYEDPGLWKFVSNTAKMESHAQKLQSMHNPIPVVSIGSGEFIQITSNSQEGLRQIELDENGFIQQETYEKYPLPYYIKKYGDSAEKEVVLSFDDGPNPAYTPEILDILSEKQVPATFFVLGKQTALYPNIVERIHREGHEIGSHTFSHSNIVKDSSTTLQLEMNSTQWLIQQATGHSTSLFRPPYTTDAENNVEDITPIIKAQEMGYTMVGSFIDTRDWQSGSSDEIVKHVTERVSNGNIILLHDSGGDRSTTVEALPKLIDSLRAEGYKFVRATDLVDKGRGDVMTTVNESASGYMFFYKIADSLYIFATKFCLVFFTVGIGFGILRLVVLLFLSYRHKRNHQKRKRNTGFTPLVSVIIPAYNEEKVVEKTVHSILKSDYPNFEVIVVDDGSTDNTSGVVAKAFSEEPRVRLITKVNGGKSSAINQGSVESDGEVIIILDADTSIAPNAISLLADYFADERVAAVSGNVKIGNVRNLLTLWQHVEYVTGFNLEKRAFDQINSITVVPGAIGAWRKSAIAEVGYFEEDTLAEDTDITLKLLRKGYRITFEPNAYAYTEAPENLNSFIKQRFRWSYGILQCLWKHRGAMFNPKQKALGFIGLPNMWAQYVLQALAPLADIVFIIGLFGDTPKILTFYFAFLALDLLVSIYSFRLEKVKTRPLLLLFIQRFVYRQFLTFTVWKSFTFAARGVLVGWNKLKRSGNVQLPVKNVEKGA